jgi:lipid A 3-O-deacylase
LRIHQFVVAMIMVGAMPASLSALQSRAAVPGSVVVQIDNDAVAGTDRGYTGGATLTWVSGDLTETERPWWLRRLPGGGSAASRASVYLMLGQGIYTPDDTRRSDLLLHDRPYGGLLLLSIGTPIRYARHEDAFEVALGIVGPASQAEGVQRLIHELLDDPVPGGWHHQLANEPIVQLSAERRWTGLKARVPQGFGADVIPHFGGGAGNLAIYSSAGMHARVGWNLPDDFGPGSIRPGGRRWGTNESGGDRLTVQLYGGVDGKLVLRDLLLEGNTFRDSHRVVANRWVADAAAGMELSTGRITVAYEQVYGTRKFRRESRQQMFSSLIVRIN